ncbi:unnamed protein product [Adineta steineri]|uniref:Uncharacterized protein n=1 Tax=Adineta steineri TaxID=433720 RepID=A0A818VKB2_9BILA|nr:unnamed protein product [Adineta steineri]CAF3713211.1 unnamed protein product [Adineta steineri]
MSNQNAARFFDTSGCLNLSRPTSGTRIASSAKQYKRPSTSSGLIRGQIKIDLYNFDHIDFADSKYVLTSPRSLEACARLNLKPATLLPKKLADLTSDKVRFSTLVDVHDEMEIDRLANLQRCRDEREKIIREETFPKSLSTKLVDSKTKSNPSNSHLHNHVESRLPPRPPSSSRLTTTNLTWKTPDDRNELRISASANFLDDVRRMDKSLQRKGTSDPNKNDQYVNGLENVKQILEQRVTRTTSDNELDSLTFEKKQHELLLSHYDHELKIQKARENARRTEKEKEAERYDSLMHEFVDQTMAEERRQNELRRKLDRLHHSRHLYEALQAKNHEIQNADTQKRRAELLNEIKRKDRRTQHFVKDKQDTVNLCRTIAKSSQDTRQYIRETKENFDEKAKKASLTSAILVTKPKIPVDRRHLQSSLRT